MRGSIENTVLDDWIAIAENFKSSIDKMLNEVHAAKMELMLLQNEIIDRLDAGQYIRDDQRIIISAPEIIIGNVNRQGILQEGGKIIIRGSETLLHGVGDEGTVKVAAPIIEQKAVDPGIDGEEEVVGNVSKIISTARNIAIDSQDPVSVEDRGVVVMELPFIPTVIFWWIRQNATRLKRRKLKNVRKLSTNVFQTVKHNLIIRSNR